MWRPSFSTTGPVYRQDNTAGVDRNHSQGFSSQTSFGQQNTRSAYPAEMRSRGGAMASHLNGIYRAQTSAEAMARREGEQSFAELTKFGLNMMSQHGSPQVINRCLGIQNNDRLTSIDKRYQLNQFIEKELVPKCYQGYAEHNAPPGRVNMTQARTMLDSLDGLAKDGLKVVAQDPAARPKPIEIKNWKQRQQDKIKDIFQPGKKKAAESLMLSRRMYSNQHIYPSSNSSYPRPSQPPMEARGKVSVAIHPDDLPRLIELMPRIFAKYGKVISEAKITAPATQQARSESALFYFNRLDREDQGMARQFLGFLERNLPNARWRTAAPGQLQISPAGQYIEERNRSNEASVSGGTRRAAQVGHAMAECFIQYGHDAEQRNRHFAGELKKAVVQDGYQQDNIALLVDRDNVPRNTGGRSRRTT